MSEFPAHMPQIKELRVAILYTIKSFGNIRGKQMLQFCMESGIINYLDLHLELQALLASRFVEKQELGYDYLLSLTEEGEKALALFQHLVAQSIISQVDNEAPKYREIFKEERQVVAECVRDEKTGLCTAVLALNDNEKPFFEIKIELPNYEYADKYCKNWKKSAQKVFENLMLHLYEGEQE